MTAILPDAGSDAAVERSPTWLRCLAIIGRSHGLNLTIPQLVQDNLLADDHITPEELLSCAKKAGLKSRMVRLDWNDLTHLKKALPALVKLKTGAGMILT